MKLRNLLSHMSLMTVACVVALSLGPVGIPAARGMDTFGVLRISTPLLASGLAGVHFGGDAAALRPAIQAEAGVGGGKLALGIDSLGTGKMGIGLKAAFLRTWLEPLGDIAADQSFIGLEGEWGFRRMVLSGGGYGRIGDGEDDWLLSVGAGILF